MMIACWRVRSCSCTRLSTTATTPVRGRPSVYGTDPAGFCGVFAALGVSTLVVCAEAAAAQLDLAAPVPPRPRRAPLVRGASAAPSGRARMVHLGYTSCGPLPPALWVIPRGQQGID